MDLRFPDRPANRQGRPPKEYPTELVDRVRSLYCDEGMTQAEVATQVGLTQKVVFNIMRRHGIPRRVAAKRDQRGPTNHMWKGDDAKYAALHLRVAAARGKPSVCAACDTTASPKFEWANLTGDYANVNDYVRLCGPCHKRMDAARRQALGRMTMPD